MNSKAKILAIYFPQLHAIAENNKWWGEGFTDWFNVKSAQPLYSNHYQPRIPFDSNYYDQSSLDTIRAQVDMAKKYGVYGFCHYHYWFDGKQLLEMPTNLFLKNKDIDFPFCLSWANETWSKRWDGRDHDILIKQTHPPTEESWSKHFDYLIEAWSDERAIQINGKPVFIIYRPQNIAKIDSMLKFWEKKAKKRGLKGVYFIYQKQYTPSKDSCLKSFDAQFQFQPFEAINSKQYSKTAVYKKIVRQLIEMFPKNVQGYFWSFLASGKGRHTIHQYDKVWSQIIKNSEQLSNNVFPGAFVDWDNTARYGKKATIISGATPERFRFWFERLIDTVSNRPDEINFVFLNAWNEWAESAYLEPDEKYGYQYLDVIKDVMSVRVGNND